MEKMCTLCGCRFVPLWSPSRMKDLLSSWGELSACLGIALTEENQPCPRSQLFRRAACSTDWLTWGSNSLGLLTQLETTLKDSRLNLELPMGLVEALIWMHQSPNSPSIQSWSLFSPHCWSQEYSLINFLPATSLQILWHKLSIIRLEI